MVEFNMLFLPKKRYIRSGLAFTIASTIELCKPEGLIAGARAIKTSTTSLRSGCMLSAAKA